MKVLVIDDEEYVRLVLEDALRQEGCDVTTVAQGQAGIEALQKTSYDCVITDLRMPGMDGRQVLQWVREHQPDVDVFVLTGHGEVKLAVEAMKAGAWDFLVKETPFDGIQVTAALTKLQAVRSLRQENLALRLGAVSRHVPSVLPGISPAWKKLMESVEKIAMAQAPVLIQGETGSGKELIARSLHQLSPRRDRPFLAVNCGAVSDHLLQSELFGHEKGAFTGATAAKIGLIAGADSGTLFLDEISEMSGPMQVSLLRVLDRGEYRQVGGTRTLTANVRFVAASNRNLQELMLAGRFRDDLLYRINTVLLQVPPLRERPEDIPRLAEHFLQTFHRSGTPTHHFPPDALERMTAYSWPGNVRELRNVVQRLSLLAGEKGTGPIGPEELAVVFPTTQLIRDREDSTSSGSLEQAEKEHILRVLKDHGGNKTQTAKRLQIDYKTLLTKLRKYGVSE